MLDHEMNLRQAFEAHYDTSELSPLTFKKYGHLLNAWERHTANPTVTLIDDAVAAGFRKSCLAAGLAQQRLTVTGATPGRF